MSICFFAYLLVKKDENDTITLDKDRLRSIRQTFEQLYQDNDLDDDHLRHETLKKLIQQFKLNDDQTSLDYLDLCVLERSDDDAEFEIKTKIRGSIEFLQPIESQKTTADNQILTNKSETQVNENKTTVINEIICIIHRKLNKPEIKEFMHSFLFRQVQPINTQSSISHPYDDGKVYPLPRGLLIDLFIRQQMNDRGTVTLLRPQTKFRLVEPISLTDEFESWTFDHFHGLLDFWLIIDPTNKVNFPSQWKLDPNAQISYILDDRLPGGDDNDDQRSKHLERPSTKSLENFIRDICQIEGNGMFKEWYEALTIDENISTYAHLTNLNQKEWDHINKLPMNALKTVKFYVDREKQMVEQRKSKKTEEQKSETSYSKAELRSNLHMIKLYFIRQLEDEDKIEPIPRLDAFCVERAFEEMREGYEDDGLFDEMKLFFQPLTVTDEELIIDSKLLLKVNREQEDEKKKLQNEIEKLNDKFIQISQRVQQLKEQLEKLIFDNREELKKIKFELKKEENQSFQKQNELNNLWAKKADVWNEKKKLLNKELRDQENKSQDIDTKKIDKENLLKIIEHNLAATKNKIDKKLVKPHRGFIMYGPPGTGKSVIMSQLAKKIGIAMLGPPLAAGELERPLVGQSEAIILDLCMRGNRLPHLMCCVSIDEIDSLAPKRDEDSSEGKVAKISVLLSVIEGIKDVPNLMFFSATNRLHMMDEAFLRRMSGKFFVGRPSSDARKRILEGIPKTILQPNIREKLATATTNFSGAALKALTSAITVHYISQKRSKEDYEISEEDTLILADRVARQYQLFLGLDTLPRLLLNNLDDRQFSDKNNSNDSDGFHLPEKRRYTGKIIISLHDQCVRIETIQNSNRRRIIEDILRGNEENLQQLLERITSYGNDRNVQLLQLIDLNLLSSKGAYDEKKIFETLKERYDECMEYKRSMIIYDLDSLIGVNQSESESSMGTSTSSSIVNQSIYIYVTSRFREAKIESNRSDKKLNQERWAIAIVRDPFLLKKFTVDADFALTEDQKEQEDEERRRSTDILICVKCHDLYIETENKMGSCTYHDGFVYDNSALDLKKYKPTQAIEQLNREEFLAFKDPTKKDEIERRKTRLKYICCYATVQVGSGGLNGCKKGKHGYGKQKHSTHHGQILDKETSDIWETNCYENIQYNQRHADLYTTRNIS